MGGGEKKLSKKELREIVKELRKEVAELSDMVQSVCDECIHWQAALNRELNANEDLRYELEKWRRSVINSHS
jgi:hypothetical protein